MRRGCAARVPFVFTNLKSGEGLPAVIGFIERQGLLDGVAAGLHR
jgi:hypothetical protein